MRELAAIALFPLGQPPVKCLWAEVFPLLRRLHPPAFPYHRPASRRPTRAPALLHRDQRNAQSSLRPSTSTKTRERKRKPISRIGRKARLPVPLKTVRGLDDLDRKSTRLNSSH